MSAGLPVRECILQSRVRRLFFNTREEIIFQQFSRGKEKEETAGGICDTIAEEGKNPVRLRTGRKQTGGLQYE